MFLFIEMVGLTKEVGFNLNTSHVLIYHPIISRERRNFGFKYISCSYLSKSLCTNKDTKRPI